MELNQLKTLLNQNNLKLSSRLDQNFLYDSEILKREVEYAELSADDVVLEIGPGVGTLTEEILKKTKNVTVIEKDAKFKHILEKLGCKVIIADAMEVEWPMCSKIISNLPYSISSPLTFKILAQDIELAVLCYQKEFARRMSARQGAKGYSRLSVNCYLRAVVELKEDIPKEKYFPIPKVDSTIVKLIPKSGTVPEHFDSICRALFQHKNKKVRNALMDSAHEIDSDKEKVKAWAEGLWEIKDRKVTQLTPEEVVALAGSWTS
ncbi:MAG: 16S rRNA (adenine(1518)-N(6)/adenine(1519)-N(6))-dimethyltransferase RsmA [archaeon]